MKSYKIKTTLFGMLFSVFSYASETTQPSAKESLNVHVKGQVIQTVEHENISCLYINSSRLNKNGDVIPGSHQKGGDVMACYDKQLDHKSLKNKFVSITADFITMNHDKFNQDLESYPVVKIKTIEKLDIKRPSYSPIILTSGYLDPGFYARTR